MDDNLSVALPRTLRVGTTVAQTIGTTTIRLPLPVFLWLCGLGLPAMLAGIFGRSGTATTLAVLAVLGWILLEARPWGYGTGALLAIVLRALVQPACVALEPVVITLPADDRAVAVARRPRWAAAGSKQP